MRIKRWYKPRLKILGFDHVAQLLIDRGAAIDHIGIIGETSLIKAAERGE